MRVPFFPPNEKKSQIWAFRKTARVFTRAKVHYQQREHTEQVAPTVAADLEICLQM
jgi:hypothetical protein